VTLGTALSICTGLTTLQDQLDQADIDPEVTSAEKQFLEETDAFGLNDRVFLDVGIGSNAPTSWNFFTEVRRFVGSQVFANGF
jgi:hypothetical protein